DRHAGALVECGDDRAVGAGLGANVHAVAARPGDLTPDCLGSYGGAREGEVIGDYPAFDAARGDQIPVRTVICCDRAVVDDDLDALAQSGKDHPVKAGNVAYVDAITVGVRHLSWRTENQV